MKTAYVKIIAFFLAVTMFAPPADARKNEDVENIGNRRISGGRVYGIFR